MRSQADKAALFVKLHEGSTFILPNPWDIGSALVLQGLGFQALATSSAAAAAAVGKADGNLTREEAVAHARAIATATDLPVSADLENGFGDSPEAVAETVRLAANSGLAGCTIEDTTGNEENPLYDFALSVERIAAAVEVVRSLPFPFVLTARTHNFFFPNPTLDETIRRLRAFEAAGANVLFAPGLPDLQSVREVCSSLSKPFNFMVGINGKSFSFAELAEAGVRRISLATSLYRAAMTGLLDAVREIQSNGQFTYLDKSVATSDILRLMGV